jgi:predicted nucleic acid-binding protein
VIVLVDTDILIDLALDREPFAEPAARLLDALEKSPGQGFVAWLHSPTFTTW